MSMEDKFINFIIFINQNLITKYNRLMLVIWKLSSFPCPGLVGSKREQEYHHTPRIEVFREELRI